MKNEDLKRTKKTRLTRYPARGTYRRETAYEIIDSTPMCHVSYIIEGEPYITPTLQWRENDDFYWHGSSASRFLRSVVGKKVSINVMLLDGLVLARSGFHHSANYRSVTMFGFARKLQDAEKEPRLKNFIDNILPGRWESLRPMSNQEVKATTVFTIPIDEASVKIRTGGPVDDEEDYSLPIWAGVIPITQIVGEPVPDDNNLPDVIEPAHARNFQLG